MGYPTERRPYDLTWSSIDGGGYTLDGTIGQTDAGSLSGGGFWSGVPALTYRVYLPITLR